MAMLSVSSTTPVNPTAFSSHPRGGLGAHHHLYLPCIASCAVRNSCMTTSSPLTMPATRCPVTMVPSTAEAVATCHNPCCQLGPSLGTSSSLPEHLTSTLMFRVGVGMQVARALPPPLQPTQQSPPSCPGGPGCRYCTKVSKSLLFYALFYLRGWDPRWEPPHNKVCQCLERWSSICMVQGTGRTSFLCAPHPF